jgi:hypothetical protein
MLSLQGVLQISIPSIKTLAPGIFVVKYILSLVPEKIVAQLDRLRMNKKKPNLILSVFIIIICYQKKGRFISIFLFHY